MCWKINIRLHQKWLNCKQIIFDVNGWLFLILHHSWTFDGTWDNMSNQAHLLRLADWQIRVTVVHRAHCLFANHKLVSSALHLSELLVISCASLERWRWKLHFTLYVVYRIVFVSSLRQLHFIKALSATALAKETTTTTSSKSGKDKWRKKAKQKKKRMDCWMSGANLHWALVIYTIIVTQVRKYKTKHRRSKEGNHSILACNNLALRLQTQPFATQQRPRQVIFHQRTTATLRDKENENVITSYPLALTAETRKRKKN